MLSALVLFDPLWIPYGFLIGFQIDFHMDSGGSPMYLHMVTNGFPIVFMNLMDSDDCDYI